MESYLMKKGRDCVYFEIFEILAIFAVYIGLSLTESQIIAIGFSLALALKLELVRLERKLKGNG